ncbi:MAG: Oligopeptide transport ATP-binding protein OppD [Chlamydiales bacterium]|nr:Oligopeptide transport ATP-binding protein OppD [Chlamydiales bacterium]
MEEVLKVSDLTTHLFIEGKAYPVVENLSFTLKKGETLALVGESGSGKSMTALSLLRILPEPPALPPQGEVLYRGENLLTLPKARMRQIRGKHIAMIFQDPMTALNPVYTIGAQLLEVTEMHMGLSAEAGLPVILKALDDVHLSNSKNLIDNYPHQLSGGMLQRVMIAMALICSPDILIADEPTTALDVIVQAQILSLLKELQDKKGMATLLITHDMGVVAENADEVVVLYAGEQIEKASVYSLFDNPSHPYTQSLFAARPEKNTHKQKLISIQGFAPRLTQIPAGCPFHPRCQYAMELCKGGKVPPFELKQPDHTANCWLYDKELDSKLDFSEGS